MNSRHIEALPSARWNRALIFSSSARGTMTEHHTGRRRIIMRILYAEWMSDLNDSVTRRLVAEGYGVDSCLDGQQAWDYLQAADYDAAIPTS